MTDIQVNERPVYGPGSRQSYFRDLAVTSELFGRDSWEVAEARERLSRYLERSERTTRQETRAMSSTATSGGAFVTPEYLVDDFALYLSPLSSFAYQCTSVPDDGVGLQMNVPAVTAPVGAAQQGSENQGIAGGGATGIYLTAALVTQAARQPVSQQLLDRAGPVALDQILGRQIGDELRAKVDVYVVAQAIANGGTVTSGATFSNDALWGDIQKAGDQMLDSAGNNLIPTHFFAQPKQIQWFFAQVDTQHRPLLTPTPQGMWVPDVKDPSGQPAAGATGHNILGLSVYHDGNIPASGSNAQLIAARPSEFFVQMSDPYFRVIVSDIEAQTLTVDIQAYCYVGVVARHTTACQVISGAAYTASPTFA